MARFNPDQPKSEHCHALHRDLFKGYNHVGYTPVPDRKHFDIQAILESDQCVMKRSRLNVPGSDWRQTIPYTGVTVVQNDLGRRRLVYARKPSTTEKDLHGKWSLGIGGHPEAGDLDAKVFGCFDIQRSMHFGMHREFDEELHVRVNEATPDREPSWHQLPLREFKLGDYFLRPVHGEPVLSGLILDDTEQVGKNHVGFYYEQVFVAENCAWESSYQFSCPEEHGCQYIGFMTDEELLANLDKFENWSKYIIENTSGQSKSLWTSEDGENWLEMREHAKYPTRFQMFGNCRLQGEVVFAEPGLSREQVLAQASEWAQGQVQEIDSRSGIALKWVDRDLANLEKLAELRAETLDAAGTVSLEEMESRFKE